MARFRIKDYIDINTKGYHNGTDWVISLDENKEHIIDESYDNKDDVEEWHSPMRKPDGGFYKDLEFVYLHVRVHIDNTKSAWYTTNVVAESTKKIIVTELDNTISEYDNIQDMINRRQ